MGFWSGFLKSLWSSTAKEMVNAAIAEAIVKVNAEIDARNITNDEKDHLKAGVVLLVARVQALIAKKLG